MPDWTTPPPETELRRALVVPDGPIAADDDVVTDTTVELDPLGRAMVPDWVDGAEPEDLAVALEAVCFSLNRAMTLAELGAILGCGTAQAPRVCDALASQLRQAGRGLMLQRHHDEVQLVTRPDVSWAVQRALNPERPGRVSKAALETLAIVAYRQPATRAQVEAIRGVSCEAVLESLERRGLIDEVGRQDTPGHPRLFGTTLRFLQIVGLERIEDLPPLPAGVEVPAFDEEGWESLAEVALEGAPRPDSGDSEPATAP